MISEHHSQLLSLITNIITTCVLQGRGGKGSKDVLMRSVGYFSSYIAIRGYFAKLEIDFYKRLLPEGPHSFIQIIKLIIAILKVRDMVGFLGRNHQHVEDST